MGGVYYNEIDEFCADWLEKLIAEKHLPAGDVDRRSIKDVKPDDVKGYTQAHFFAGLGGWPLALRLAGWPDNRPVWTGSCPCQPFSASGKQKGFGDERHLWPVWFGLIKECVPPIIFGEQVEAAIRHGWLDAVFADLEGQGYACGAAVLPACGVGAPHIRQRLWFVADSDGGDASAEGLQRSGEHRLQPQGGGSGELADAASFGHDGWRSSEALPHAGPVEEPERFCVAGRVMGDAQRTRLERQPRNGDEGDQSRRFGTHANRSATASGAHGFWSGAEWLPCTDGKARPVEPGTFPLAHGIPGRVGRLRAYGNAIVPQLAAEFICAAQESFVLAVGNRDQ